MSSARALQRNHNHSRRCCWAHKNESRGWVNEWKANKNWLWKDINLPMCGNNFLFYGDCIEQKQVICQHCFVSIGTTQSDTNLFADCWRGISSICLYGQCLTPEYLNVNFFQYHSASQHTISSPKIITIIWLLCTISCKMMQLSIIFRKGRRALITCLWKQWVLPVF